MYRFWPHVTAPVLRAAGARALVEIGAGQGAQTRRLLDYCVHHDGTLTVIDPAPALDVDAWTRQWGARLRFVRQPSLDALPTLEGGDAALVDGDHNWHTVIHELRLLSRTRGCEGRAPVMIVHDTGWPYGRRDMYYAPERVPAEARHPHAHRGLEPGDTGVVAGGLLEEYWNATREGGPRNGVMTAVEDFVGESGDRFHLVDLPGLHGLAILAERALVNANPALAAVLASFALTDFARGHLARVEHEHLVEEARIRRYTRK